MLHGSPYILLSAHVRVTGRVAAASDTTPCMVPSGRLWAIGTSFQSVLHATAVMCGLRLGGAAAAAARGPRQAGRAVQCNCEANLVDHLCIQQPRQLLRQGLSLCPTRTALEAHELALDEHIHEAGQHRRRDACSADLGAGGGDAIGAGPYERSCGGWLCSLWEAKVAHSAQEDAGVLFQAWQCQAAAFWPSPLGAARGTSRAPEHCLDRRRRHTPGP
jgi:hypothetical protein